MQVKTGGAYYMISRTLGLEIGGAIGAPLYFSQAISIAFYIIGFTEALALTIPSIPSREISIALVLFFGLLAYLGADFIIRIQFYILGILGLALISFFSGLWEASFSTTPVMHPEVSISFWEVFAVFFPAVTGIMVGVGMSGDLKNPEKDIPVGTLASIGVTTIIYIGVAVALSFGADPEMLRNETLVMADISLWPQLILLGIWGATLSSAMGSALAAPRILQALSFDRIAPSFMGNKLGSSTEPRMAVLITTAIALTVVFLGQLNFVANLITMFFLNTYGMINLTAGLENLIGNPSFRPHFRVPWIFSLLGGIGCYAAMVLIHPLATVIAVLFSYGIYFLLKRKSLRQRWGDLRTGFFVALVRFALLRLQNLPVQTKNWRPNIIAFTRPPGTEHGKEQLMEMAVWLSRGGGIVTLSHLLVGEMKALAGKGYRETSRNHIKKYLKDKGGEAFGDCTIVSNFYEGVSNVAQAHGLASTAANILLLGWAKRVEDQEQQVRLMRDMMELNKSVLLLYYNTRCEYGNHQRIDIWWRGQRDRNAQLMLMLTHIICKSGVWEDAEIRLLRLLENKKGVDRAKANIHKFLKQARLRATPVVLTKERENGSFTDILVQNSGNTDLTLLGLPDPRNKQIRTMAHQIRTLLHSMRSTILVRCAEDNNILENNPESS